MKNPSYLMPNKPEETGDCRDMKVSNTRFRVFEHSKQVGYVEVNGITNQTTFTSD